MKIYEFLYCDCIHESSYATLSVHRTKVGAYKAMRKHRLKTYDEWYEERMKYGKKNCSDFPDNFSKAWTIGEMELLD